MLIVLDLALAAAIASLAALGRMMGLTFKVLIALALIRVLPRAIKDSDRKSH
ncbi:MAG TPA: hypothetical protein VGL42_15830 [Opitutaceae bacterium]